MICPQCNGTGYCDLYMENECPVCHGTGETEQTNEEWLHTLPIEEMADEIISHIAHEIGLARYYNDDDVKEFVEWLKEKHDG